MKSFAILVVAAVACVASAQDAGNCCAAPQPVVIQLSCANNGGSYAPAPAPEQHHHYEPAPAPEQHHQYEPAPAPYYEETPTEHYDHNDHAPAEEPEEVVHPEEEPETHQVTLITGRYNDGYYYPIQLEKGVCFNLSGDLRDIMKSLKTERLVELFSEEDCTGKTKIVGTGMNEECLPMMDTCMFDNEDPFGPTLFHSASIRLL